MQQIVQVFLTITLLQNSIQISTIYKFISLFGLSYIITTVSRCSNCNLLSFNYGVDPSVCVKMSLKISTINGPFYSKLLSMYTFLKTCN